MSALEWVRAALAPEKVVAIPLTAEMAIRAAAFGEQLHRDPADRFLVATAIELRVPLVTKDAQIQQSGLIETIW